MHSKGIIHSGLSGKKLTTTTSSAARSRRTTSGPMGPPLMTRSTCGRQSSAIRCSRPSSTRVYNAFVGLFL